jgi:uncharacterized repeat protein (TIGR02543 family)
MIRLQVSDSGSLTYGEAFTVTVSDPVDTLSCPPGYVPVAEYQDGETGTVPAFCVMKYEAKNVGAVATSQAGGLPWTGIPRGATAATAGGAWKTCRDVAVNGYEFDLLSNAQWQSLARQIETYQSAPGFHANWQNGSSSGANALNRGNSSLGSALAADGDDANGCLGTTNPSDCNDTWNLNKRTHALPNGQVIWDLAGNVWEWVKDDSTFDYGFKNHWNLATSSDGNACLAGSGCTGPQGKPKAAFGPFDSYPDKTDPPCGGLGFGWTNATAGMVTRGGAYNEDEDGYSDIVGVFSTSLTADVGSDTVGFRCAAVPVFGLSITSAGTGTGTVTSAPAGISCGSTCSASFPPGQEVTLTASPDPGYVFDGWTGDCAGKSACTVVMGQTKTVTATFIVAKVLTVSYSGTGSVSSSPVGVACGAACSAPFEDGTVVTLTAAPTSHFIQWDSGCGGAEPENPVCQVTMDMSHSVQAMFCELNCYWSCDADWIPVTAYPCPETTCTVPAKACTVDNWGETVLSN